MQLCKEKKKMKKVLSFLMVCVMLASLCVLPTSAAQSNKDFDALAFGANKPTFDGVISAEEWGNYTVEVKGSEAAGKDATAVSAANTTVWNEKEEAGDHAQLNYRIWLRWDNDYYYIAAEIDDYDGYYNKRSRGDIWNGDCFQFRVDDKGPNSAQAAAEDGYDHTVTAFNKEKYDKPWADVKNLMNTGCAINTTSTKDPKPRWLYDMDSGLGDLTKKNKNHDSIAQFAMEVTPAATGELVTIEVALPWDMIIRGDQPINKTTYGIGKVLGMSAVYLNSSSASEDWSGFLQWGSGITDRTTYAMDDTEANKEGKLNPNIYGGSQAITLVGTDALTGEKVDGLFEYEPVNDPVPYKDQVLAVGYGQAYMSADDVRYDAGSNVIMQYEVALCDVKPVNPETTVVGFVFGGKDGEENARYGTFAGYDYNSKSWVIGNFGWENGCTDIFASAPYEWTLPNTDESAGALVPATWHRLTLKIEGKKASLYVDGALAVETEKDCITVPANSEDPKFNKLAPILYNCGKAIVDNIKITTDLTFNIEKNTGNVDLADYNISTTDRAFLTSTIGRNCKGASDWANIVDYDPMNVNSEDGYYSEKLGNPILPGDMNGDGKTNNADVILLICYQAGWTGLKIVEEAADFNGDGSVNMKDIILLIRALV